MIKLMTLLQARIKVGRGVKSNRRVLRKAYVSRVYVKGKHGTENPKKIQIFEKVQSLQII